jgi:hypothetical protein
MNVLLVIIAIANVKSNLNIQEGIDNLLTMMNISNIQKNTYIYLY